MTTITEEIREATASFGKQFARHLHKELVDAGAYLCRVDTLCFPGDCLNVSDDTDAVLIRAEDTVQSRCRASFAEPELAASRAEALAVAILRDIPEEDGRLNIVTARLPIPTEANIFQSITTLPQIVVRTTFHFSYELDAYEMVNDVLYGVVRE